MGIYCQTYYDREPTTMAAIGVESAMAETGAESATAAFIPNRSFFLFQCQNHYEQKLAVAMYILYAHCHCLKYCVLMQFGNEYQSEWQTK